MRIMQEQLGDSSGSPKIIACSAVMHTVFDEIRRTAQADATVLVTGNREPAREWWPKRFIAKAGGEMVRSWRST